MQHATRLHLERLPSLAKPNSPQYQHPFVMIRGLGRSSSFWLNFKDEIRAFAPVIMVDLLGTGKSKSWLGNGSISSHAADVIQTLVSEGIGECYILGISLGGMVGLEVCEQVNMPGGEFYEKLKIHELFVLASSARGLGHQRISKKALVVLLKALFRLGPPAHKKFAHFLVSSQTLLSNPLLPETWDQIWKNEGFSKIATLRQLIAASLYRLRSHELSKTVRKTFIVSKDDALVDWKNSVALWEKFTHSRLLTMEGLGHDFPTEDPKAVANLISQVLVAQE